MSISNPFLKIRMLTGGVFVSYILLSEFVADYPRSWSSDFPAGSGILLASAPVILIVWSILSLLSPDTAQRRLLIGAGFLIILHLMYACAFARFSFELLMLLLIDAVLFFLYLPLFTGKSIGFARAATLFLVIVPAALLMVWSTSTIWFASSSARAAAAGGPFCVALGAGIEPWRGGKYKVATRLRDLQGLVMQAPQQQGNTSWFYFTFNAIEITTSNDKQIYWNWSHWKLGFERIEHQDLWGGLTGACKPELNFVDNLPW